MKGISPGEKLGRRHLLSEHLDQTVEAMKQSGIQVPVGLIVDATDRLGGVLYRQMLCRSGMTKKEANLHMKEIAAEMAERNQFPTGIFVVSWADANRLLPLTSPTAKKNLLELQAEYKIGRSSKYLVVAIGNCGNTYAISDMPEMPRAAIPDVQHRHGGLYWRSR